MAGNEAGEVSKDQLMEAGPYLPCFRNLDFIKADEGHLGREKIHTDVYDFNGGGELEEETKGRETVP